MENKYALETIANDGESPALNNTRDNSNYKTGGLSNYLKSTKAGKYVAGGVAGLTLLSMVGCASIGTVNGVSVYKDQKTEQSSEKGNRLTEWVKEHPYLTILGTALVAGAIYGLTKSDDDSDDDYVPPRKPREGGSEG